MSFSKEWWVLEGWSRKPERRKLRVLQWLEIDMNSNLIKQLKTESIFLPCPQKTHLNDWSPLMRALISSGSSTFCINLRAPRKEQWIYNSWCVENLLSLTDSLWENHGWVLWTFSPSFPPSTLEHYCVCG